jgi:hypothetical protein
MKTIKFAAVFSTALAMYYRARIEMWVARRFSRQQYSY